MVSQGSPPSVADIACVLCPQRAAHTPGSMCTGMEEEEVPWEEDDFIFSYWASPQACGHSQLQESPQYSTTFVNLCGSQPHWKYLSQVPHAQILV